MLKRDKIFDYLNNFKSVNKTFVDYLKFDDIKIPRFTNEFWTSRQRQANSLHEVPYRACFKPQLPNFFIRLLSKEGDFVYDPFSGRGTTIIEAAILGRNVISNDTNPLSTILCKPRLNPPKIEALTDRLSQINIDSNIKSEIDLSMFYHEKTLLEILSLKEYLKRQKKKKKEDEMDDWIRMVATTRLTGHSTGFFSVYTLPPNQAVSQESQKKINKKRRQKPNYRNTKKLIVKKTKSLIRDVDNNTLNTLSYIRKNVKFLEKDARHTDKIKTNSIQLVVTSPPFLDVVQYVKDNWLRCWFNDIDPEDIERKITMAKQVTDWSAIMGQVFFELFRVVKSKGYVAFEVGEVRNAKINLDEVVVPLGLSAGFECRGIIINRQKFTKTSNIWGVSNNNGGTNSNRIVLFYKE